MPDTGMGSWPMRRARIDPDRIAFRQGDRTVSYSELATRVENLAAGLARLGLEKGDRIAYLGPNDIAAFESFFAAGRIGAIFVALNTRLSAAEIAYMLSDSGTTVLVHAEETAELARSADAAAQGVRTLIALPGAGGPGALDYEDVIAAGAPHEADRDVGLGDDALILYTSGTTGRPKGAVLTHANLTFNAMNQLAHTDVLGSDVVLCIAPLFHVTGLGLVSLPTLFKGGTIVMAPRFDPEWVLRTIAKEQIVAFSAVPTMLQMLCDHPAWDTADLTSMRYVVFGGSPVRERVARAWHGRGVAMHHGYGMTEGAPGVFMATPEGGAERPTSAGVPHFFVDVALGTAEGDTSDPPGVGELLIRGPNVFHGYWGRPEESAAGFEDGWFRTGDLVRVAPDGWAYIVDRVKDMIISGGENVYPAEVEAVIAQVPGVAENAVVGVPDDRWGEVGCAFVVRTADGAVDEAALRRGLEGRIARYKIPRYFHFVADLPVTASGKVRKSVLRAAAAERTGAIEETP